MTTFNFDQLEELWVAAGGSPDWAETMASVAEVESGGSSTATYNGEPAGPKVATGIWQELGHGTTAEEEDPGWSTLWAVKQLGSGAGISAWGKGTGDPVGTASQAAGNVPLPATTLQRLVGSKATVSPLTAAQLAQAQSKASHAEIQGSANLASQGGNFNPLGGAGVSGVVSNTTGAVKNAVSGQLSGTLGDVGTYILKGVLTLAFAGIGVLGVSLLTGRGKGGGGGGEQGGLAGLIEEPAVEKEEALPPFPEEIAA
jgi:hypothetical protein